MSGDEPYKTIVTTILENEDEESWQAVDWARSLWANWHTLSETEKRSYVRRLVKMSNGDYELPSDD